MSSCKRLRETRQKLQLQNRMDLDAKAKNDDFGALFKRNFKRKITSAKFEKISWQITIAALMQPLQYDSRCPAAKDNSITHAAAAPSNLDAATTMRSAETDLQSAIELRATASEIAAPKPDGSRRQSQKTTILEHFSKGFLKGKSPAPNLRKSRDKALSQPWCSHSNTIGDVQLPKTIVLRTQPRRQATLTQPFQCDLPRAWSEDNRDRLAPVHRTSFPTHTFRDTFVLQNTAFRASTNSQNAFRAKLPSKSESGRCDNEAFVRDSPQNLKVEDAKTQFSSLCLDIPLLWHPSALTSLWFDIPLMWHPAVTSLCCDIPSLWHPFAVTSLCFDIPLLWHPFAVTSLCCDITLLWHPFALTSLCCDIPSLWHPFAVTSLCFDIPLLWHPFAGTSLCCDIPLLWHPFAVTSLCCDIPLLWHPFAVTCLCFGIFALTSLCCDIPLWHASALTSLCLDIPLMWHPAVTPLCCDIPSLWHPFAVTSLCFDIPLLWHPFAVTSLCCDITLLWHSFAVTSLCCDIPSLWHPFAVTSLCFDIPLLWHPFAGTSLCCDIPLLWHPFAVTSLCCDIPLLWHPFALTSLCCDIPLLWHPLAVTSLCCDIPLLCWWYCDSGEWYSWCCDEGDIVRGDIVIVVSDSGDIVIVVSDSDIVIVVILW